MSEITYVTQRYPCNFAFSDSLFNEMEKSKEQERDYWMKRLLEYCKKLDEQILASEQTDGKCSEVHARTP